jgi:hypothetical protein
MGEFIRQENIETMTNENAADIKLHFGKHKGKTLREVFNEDKSYINWLLNNERTDKNIKQACELIVNAVKEAKKKQQVEAEPTPPMDDTLEQGSFYDADDDDDLPF